MLHLLRNIKPFPFPAFSKVKAPQMTPKGPSLTLRPPPPGFKKPTTEDSTRGNPFQSPSASAGFKSPFQTRIAMVAQQVEQQPLRLQKKHPVVTIMGHVDHGKTTLIDYLRKSNIADKEDGGITQRIGAFRIEYKGQRITFIDTPGHEAFTNMRERGAVMTDLVVLMISAVEGVKNQTRQVISLIKKLEIPVIVAINKIDLPHADPESIERQIQEAGLDIEPLGGQVPVVHISAKAGTNVDLLCDLIQEETRDLTAVFQGLVQACVLEANQTKDGLNSMTIIMEKGILKPNSLLIVGTQSVKVKTILGDRGENLVEAFPGEAVQIVGIPFIPSPGDNVFEVENEKKAQFLLTKKKMKEFESEKSEVKAPQSLKANMKFEKSRSGRKEKRAFHRGVQEVWMKKFSEQEELIVTKIQQLREREPNEAILEVIDELELKLAAHKKYVFEYIKNTGESPDILNFIMKFGDRGMEETILMQLEKLKPIIEAETKVKLNLLRTDVGDVTVGDLEEANNCSAKIFTFGAGMSAEAKANLQGMEPPRTHTLIHNLLKDIKSTSFNKKINSIKGIERARCEIAEIYTLKIKKSESRIPGIKVTAGKISRNHKCYIFRNNIPISQPFSITFIKTFKKDVMDLKRGEEGTLGFLEEITDIEKGDEIVAFEV